MATVAGAASVAAFFVNRQMSSSLDRYPFILQGVHAAALPANQLGYWKLAHEDRLNNIGYATVSVDGRKVRISARRIVPTRPDAEVGSVRASDVYEDLEGEGSGLAFYWENPWEIKASVIRGVKWGSEKIRYSVSSFFGQEEAMAEEEGQWEIISVAVDNDAVVGDKLSHPDFASAAFLKENGMKTETSKNRAISVLSGLFLVAGFLGAKRAYTNYRMWPSYVFARSYVLKHPVVKEFFKSEVDVVTRTGKFESKMIEAELTIAAKDQAVESVVKFSASRTGNGNWTVSQALMTPPGCKPIDLLGNRPPA